MSRQVRGCRRVNCRSTHANVAGKAIPWWPYPEDDTSLTRSASTPRPSGVIEHFTLDVHTEESGSVRLRNSTIGANERPGFSDAHPNTTMLRTCAIAG